MNLNEVIEVFVIRSASMHIADRIVSDFPDFNEDRKSVISLLNINVGPRAACSSVDF